MDGKGSHTVNILQKLLSGDTMISCDVLASNSNQYFKQIKDNGIELIEWNDATEGKHLKRKLYQSPENIERAVAYLKKIAGKPDEFQ